MKKILVKTRYILKNRPLRNTVLVLLLIGAFSAKAEGYQSIEVKGVKTEYDQEKGTIKYNLYQPCLVRQYIQVYDGPVVSLGLWEIKKEGHYEEHIAGINQKILNSRQVMPALEIYSLPDDSDMDMETLTRICGIEQDLQLDISIVPPRLGKYIHDYQNNIKKIKIDIPNRDGNNLYTVKCAIDYKSFFMEKNIALPYIFERDFGIFLKGKHRLYIEIRGEDNAAGIGNIEIEVI